MIPSRRSFLVGSAALAAGASVSLPFFLHKYHSDQRARRSRVAILSVEQYSQRVDEVLASGLRLFRINVQGKTIVLKPNLVDYIPGNAINTHPTLVLAAAESFRRMGPKCVIVAERPGHQRDTQLVLSESGYQESLRAEAIRFVDLNRDELVRTQLRASYMGTKSLWLPRTVLEADFLVSMPKIKAHHWAGATLSMKNMLGVVPGARYGWPKNILHWKGIQESILDVCATIPVHFVIADGIVAMEGNGPLNGTARPLGKIVLADDPVAADSTCARLMGFEPDRIAHICEGARFLGNASPALIDQAGEIPRPPTTPFQVVPEFRHLYAPMDSFCRRSSPHQRQRVLGFIPNIYVTYEPHPEPHLPPDRQAETKKPEEIGSDDVRRAVSHTIRMLKNPTEERQRPIFVARNLYFLLDELEFPNIERLNEALRPYWPTLWRVCARGHYFHYAQPLQDPNSSVWGMDAPLNPPLPKFEEGDYRLEFVRSASDGFSVWLSFPGRLSPLYPVEGYPKISEFRTILERLDVKRVLISWNGRYFLAYTVADEKDEIGVNFRAADNGITFNFRGEDWQSIKKLFRRAWQAPQVRRLWDALALEYGEL